METEIVFCERCGVSIPESEVGRARQASGGKDLCPNCLHPRRESDGDLRLYFCENCRVSIAVTDVLTGLARPDGNGYHCSVCSRATPAERVTRRTAVERELHAAVPAAAPRAPGADPIYFCDVCTSSIPAAHVATGRAVVQDGRTLCERCGARPGAGRIHAPAGPGALPVVAAALLAAAMGAGGFALWQEWGGPTSSAAGRSSDGDALAALRRETARDRADAAAALGVVTTKTDAALRALEARVDAALGEARAAKQAAAKGGGSDALVDRVDETNSRIDDLEDELRALRGSVAGGRGVPAEAPMPSAPAVDEMPVPDPTPDPAPAGGAAPGPMAAKDPSDAVKRCVALLKDKEIGVRFAAALELGKIAGKRAPSGEGSAVADTADFDYAWPALAQSLRKDDDAFVRRACARSLGEIKAWDAFPELAESLLDPEEYVALQASRVIKEMAGQEFGFRQNQAKADRKRVADRSKKWWDENKDRISR